MIDEELNNTKVCHNITAIYLRKINQEYYIFVD